MSFITNRKKGVVIGLILSLVASSMGVSPVNAATEVSPYGSFSLLDFESSPPSYSTWGGTIDLQFVKNDPLHSAHSGSGALYINSDGGKFSVWGGPTSDAPRRPAEGDKVGGYFYYKRISEKAGEDWKLPRVRIYPESEGNSPSTWLAVTKDIDTTSNRIGAVGEWVKVELESTGKTIAAEDIGHLGYNITCDGTGNEFMIDDVVFGAITEADPTPTPAPTIKPTTEPSHNSDAVVPIIDEYIGSSMNGDFEVGNDSVGNQYWGTYPDGMMTLITNPQNTICKSAVSGNNVIKINDKQSFNSAWNLFNFAENDVDTLPRLGDRVGGSYWIFVPENADLTKNVPYVTFGYQHPTRGDVEIATGEHFDKTKLVRGQWNEIPIMPMDDGQIDVVDPAKHAAIFVKAIGTDQNVNYYIDKISVGKLVEGVFFSDNTSLNTIPNDAIESVNANIVIQNTKLETKTDAKIFVAVYDGTKLDSVEVKDITIPSRGASGISTTQTTISNINVKGINRDRLKIKAFTWADMTPLTQVKNLYYKTKLVSPDDKNITYIGRWHKEGNAEVGTFVRPYFKTSFTGRSVAVDIGRPTMLQVTIDGKTSMFNTVVGKVVLAENLSDSMHTLRVASVDYSEGLVLNGIYIDNDAELMSAQIKDKHIEFIGDSITAWNNGYSWQVGEALGVEHTRIAWPGIALMDNKGNTSLVPLYGISSAYFKNGLSGVQGMSDPVADWDFNSSSYTPDIAVINIGTNDADTVWYLPDQFTSTYSTFIDNVRSKLPNTEIFVLRAVSMPHGDILNPAVEAMVKAKMTTDSKLHYIDTSTWGVSINPNDNIHPDSNGHTTMTNKLCSILEPYVSGNVPTPTPTPTKEPEDNPSTGFVPYGCWSNLKFDTGSKPANSDTWSGKSGEIEFTTTQSHTGAGSLKLNGTSASSIWGTRVAGEPYPAAGDTVTGYFWIKLLAKTNSLPNVKMVKYDDHSVIFAKTKELTQAELAALPIGEWVKIELESTGVTYTEGNNPSANATSGFVIETPQGVNCLIDDVTFGKVSNGNTPGGETPNDGEVEIVNGLKKINPDNINIRYVGRWSGDSASFESGWIRPYIKLKFTGTTLKMDLQEETNLQVMIDGKRVYGNYGSEYSTVNGQVTIASGLSNGEHEVRISTIDLYKRIKYSGFWVDENSVLSQPTTYKTHIEFIGDSITSANDGYAWTAGEALKVEHTRISWPGISLTDTRGYTGFYPYYGMETAYSFVTLPGSQNTKAGVGKLWDFDKSQYTPDIFVINLGTNDAEQITGNAAAVKGFENSYKKLINELRAKYPNAEIFALRAVSIPNADVNNAAQNAIMAMAAVDSKVHYVDTTSWDVEISADNIHPTMAGYNTMSARLVDILRKYVTTGTQTVTPSSIPGIREGSADEGNQVQIEPYGCFDALGFEAAPNKPSGADTWSAVANTITFTTEKAHTGNGSMKINGAGPSSMWGTTNAGGQMPQAGDMVAGYFWVYLLSTPTALPTVKMADANNMQTIIYATTDSNVDLSSLPLNEWIKLNIKSTGTAYQANPATAFVVETGAGFNGYIDDIVFGKVK